MTLCPLIGFEAVYLEDSYLLGIAVSGSGLRLRVLFAMTRDFPGYETPLPGEQHCYREGEIVVDGLKISEWQAGRPSISTDPDGSQDLGDIAVSVEAGGYRIGTDWFDMRFDAERVAAVIW
jgi:hypothetical protein